NRQQRETPDRRLGMEHASLHRTGVVPPEPECVRERAEAETRCLAVRHIPKLGLPALEPLGALIGGRQRRGDAKGRVLPPFTLHTSRTSSAVGILASNG